MKFPALFLSFLALPLAAQQPVRYSLSFPNAEHHEAEIRATFADLPSGPLEVVMSRSSPGRYALHEFAKNVYNVRATDSAGRVLPVERPAPSQWEVSGHDGTVTFAYTLFGDRVDGTYAAIDSTHAHLNIPATLVWARGLEQRPVEVDFQAPPGSGWQVATQLDPRDGGWWAPNLDRLMDSPVEFSVHTTREWQAGGTRFRLVLHGEAPAEALDDFVRMCEAIVLQARGVFGEFPAYDHGLYTFLLDDLPYASGDGMEHRDSTVITSGRALGPRSAVPLTDPVAHEFFHSWNVERLRPRSLEPFDFERANMSGELWFAEGFTNYYGPLLRARAGVTDRGEFFQHAGGAVNATLTAPGREVFNVIEMSRRAPFADGASGNEPTNLANTFLSYYLYGEALGLGFDLAIRTQFPGKSLDDWMRVMWREHPSVDRPYTLDDLQAGLAEATGSASFAEEMFRRHIHGLEPLDFQELLAPAGLLLRPARAGEVWLGTRGLSITRQGIEITAPVQRGSTLYRAGIDRGDRLVRAGRRNLRSQRDLDRLLKSSHPGQTVTFVVEGRAGRREVEAVWQESRDLQIVPYEQAGLEVTPAIEAFRDAWLGSKPPE